MGVRAPGLVSGPVGKQYPEGGIWKGRGKEVGWSPKAPLLGTRAKERGGCHGDGEAGPGGTRAILYALAARRPHLGIRVGL